MGFLRILETIRTPFWDAVFQFFTYFGEETFFMVMGMTIFWCISKRMGYFLLYISFLGNVINQFLKLLFCIPRPWLIDDQFTIVESARGGATGYSFPSGHTQGAAGLFLGIGRQVHNTAVRICCVALVLIVAFSRMYLGVHTPADVLVSLGIATLLVMGSAPLFHRAWVHDWKWYLLLCGIMVGAAIGLVAYGEFATPPANAIPEFTEHGISTAYKMLGSSIAYCLVLWLDTRYIRFDVRASWWAQILKVFIGLALVVAIQNLLKAPLLSLTNGHHAADGIRYFLMVVTGGALWPLTFRWFAKTAKQMPPEPDVPAAA